MVLCPSDEASGPLLGRCVSLLYWCEDRPLRPEPSTPLKAINLWPTVPCTLYPPKPLFLSHTPTDTHVYYPVYTTGSVQNNNLWSLSVVCCVNFNHPCLRCFFLCACVQMLVVKDFCVKFLWIFLIPFSQPVEATHSIQYRQTETARTHSRMNSHTDDSCPLQGKRGGGSESMRWRQAEQRGSIRIREIESMLDIWKKEKKIK